MNEARQTKALGMGGPLRGVAHLSKPAQSAELRFNRDRSIAYGTYFPSAWGKTRDPARRIYAH